MTASEGSVLAATSARLLAVLAAACALVAAPVAHAQPAGKVPRIGFLSSFAAQNALAQHARDYFLQGLREHGYVEGQNVTVEHRWADGRNEQLPRLASELVRAKVDVLVAHGGVPSALAARQATKTIPIVITGVVDPAGIGLVASLARPGGNITGSTIIPEAMVGKQLQLLKEVVPTVSRVAVLWNPDNPGNVRQLRAAEAVPGLRLEPVGARNSAEIDQALAPLAERRPDAVLVLLEPIYLGEGKKIADLAIRNRLPSVYGYRTHADDGGLMAYGASRVELNKQVAFYVARILKGAKPADLPVSQPTKFELVINMKTAKALGLKIPSSVLLRADEVIEK